MRNDVPLYSVVANSSGHLDYQLLTHQVNTHYIYILYYIIYYTGVAAFIFGEKKLF
ncbi:hypothetical protein O3M35_005781 [Rhynocoris fuscipes]|uniref:Uncharacterized protein n=1 Tax=Rhynocoris fuscipes TaxID=488301 RepID=A0AAW1DLK8_9HEMI